MDIRSLGRDFVCSLLEWSESLSLNVLQTLARSLSNSIRIRCLVSWMPRQRKRMIFPSEDELTKLPERICTGKRHEWS